MDALIVRALCRRKQFQRLREHIPGSMLAPDTTALLSWLALYWQTYTDSDEVNWDSMNTLVNLRGQGTPPEQLATLRAMIRQVQSVPEAEIAGTVKMISELAFSGEVAALTKQYQDGAEVDFFQEMKQLQRKYAETNQAQDSLLTWENRDVDAILEDNDEAGGLLFRSFPELRTGVRGARGGDCIAFAAPVDAGKTSLLAVTAVDFAEQMHEQPEKYGDRPILWLVNESLASRTVPRIYQAATGWTLAQIRDKHKAGEFAPAYLNRVGSFDRIRVKDAHSLSMHQIATLIEEMNPAVLIIDMVANIRGGTMETEHQNLEAKWQELRVLGCEHDCIMVGTMQMSAEGYDLLYPPMTALKQSKIGVQGALDLLIMMGRLNPQEAPDRQSLRGISTPKNKMARSGYKALHQFEVEFNGGTCRFLTGE